MSMNRTTMRKATEGTSNRLMSLKGVRRNTNDSVSTRKERKIRGNTSANEAKNQGAALLSDHCRKTATSEIGS